MKLEDIKNRTKEATDYLVQSLESGHSEVLTEYLGAMAKFHTYSFGNIMLIARQKTVGAERGWSPHMELARPLRSPKGKGHFSFSLLWSAGKAKAQKRPQRRTERRKTRKPSSTASAPSTSSISRRPKAKSCRSLTEVKGEVTGYRERLVKFVAAQTMELRYSDKIGPVKGLSQGGKITLLSGMQPAEEFSVLAN